MSLLRLGDLWSVIRLRCCACHPIHGGRVGRLRIVHTPGFVEWVGVSLSMHPSRLEKADAGAVRIVPQGIVVQTGSVLPLATIGPTIKLLVNGMETVDPDVAKRLAETRDARLRPYFRDLMECHVT